MLTSSINQKPIEKSPVYHRLRLTSNEEFTIPDTATFFCSGGGIFRNGIAIGGNSSIIPGSIRYNDDKLQYLKNEGWVNITGFFENNCRENSIAKFGSDGVLTDTNILIENNDITGVETLETEYIVPPDSKNLKLGGIQWPTSVGDTHRSLRFTSPGVLEPTDHPVPIYDVTSELKKLVYFCNDEGKLISSNINVTEYDLSNIGTISSMNLKCENIHISSNTSQGSSGITLCSDNGKISFTNNNNEEKVSICVRPPANSNSLGNKGDIAYDDCFIYVCISENCWKRASLSSW